MIDWVKARLPWNWEMPICGGHVVRVRPDGEVEHSTMLVAQARGSFDESFTLRTIESGWLEVDGNPSKFLQGHNCFGVGGLAVLTWAATMKALKLIGAPEPCELTQERWKRGYWDISRVDVTESFKLDNAADVRAWIQAAGETSSMKYKGRATMTSGTLYFGKVAKGKRGSRWSLKCYSKGDEIAVQRRGHMLPEFLPARQEITDWASNVLRVEILLRAAELERHGGEMWLRASSWTEPFAEEMFWRYFGKMEIGEAVMLEAKEIEDMKTGEKAAYNLWLAGADLRGIYKRPTLYRYRKSVKEKTGGRVDLMSRVSQTNVVQLRRVLTLKPARVPDWAAERGVLWQQREVKKGQL